MRLVLSAVAALLALASVMSSAGAKLQPDMMCIHPDMEFPVACDQDDD